jgi:adenine-specific DNA-methyltransferase
MRYETVMAALSLFALDEPMEGPVQLAESAPETRKAELGQFMTPTAIATFMAEQFEFQNTSEVVLLDAGAGQGSLSAAFVARWEKIANWNGRLTVHAYELDPKMIEILGPRLRSLQSDKRISTEIIDGDFIANAAAKIRSGERIYSHAILNPPYKKIGSDSSARQILSGVGIETVNLYSGFVALSLEMLRDGGQLVAIIPRSFCNGPYYRSFRKFLLGRAAIESIHLFDSRNEAFADDGVLQENVVIRLKKGARQGSVVISRSTNSSFSDLKSDLVAFDRIVHPEDKEKFIRIPSGSVERGLGAISGYSSTLQDIGVSVSTGPIVDFRMKEHLQMKPLPGSVPLLYPGHFVDGKLIWPRPNFKKPNAIIENEETRRWLFPRGFYVAVKRFSSKEEKRRIVATLIDPAVLPDSSIGFENHLNVIHINKGPLPEDLARGLAVYLNANVVDSWFRQFNGHTQVNATDIRSLPFPNREKLIEFGKWHLSTPGVTQSDIDMEVAGFQ